MVFMRHACALMTRNNLLFDMNCPYLTALPEKVLNVLESEILS